MSNSEVGARTFMDKDGREHVDRRNHPTPMISRYTFRGRRRTVRRDEEGRSGFYVDRFTSVEIVAVLVLLLLTVTDALATLYILSQGGIELNPIMRNALEVGDRYFLMCKVAVSLFGAFLILLHTRFPGVRRALYILLTLYGSVVVYHAYLLTRTVG